MRLESFAAAARQNGIIVHFLSHFATKFPSFVDVFSSKNFAKLLTISSFALKIFRFHTKTFFKRDKREGIRRGAGEERVLGCGKDFF
jgi:hypothetical protein